MTKDKRAYQVIIVGAGPAGIATALTLTARGVSNCMIEARLEPTRKLGEAIPPIAKPLLKKLEILHLVDAPEHITYYGNKSCWGTDKLQQSEFIQGIHGHGYLLDRCYFEKQLRKHAVHSGCLLKAGYKLKKVLRTVEGIEVHIDNGETTASLTASYIVDATGRKASVSRQLGMTKRSLDSQFAVVFKAMLSTPMEHQIMVEATKNGWWYMAPQNETELTLMFFTLKELLPPKNEMESFVNGELETSLYLSKITSTASLDFDNIQVMPAGTSRLDSSYGDHWMAVGDAAFSFDPISSYGITNALASGYYAGHALASKLENEKDAMSAYGYVVENAFQAYMEKLWSHYQLETRWEGSTYWKNRFPIATKE